MNSIIKSMRVLSVSFLLSMSMNLSGATFHINCPTGGNDRAAIQDAIDLAEEHDVVHIHGTCVMDGTRVAINKSHLTIRGDATDTDSDGKVDQWNTTLLGTGDFSSRGFLETLFGPWQNLGLYVGNIPATDDDIIGVTIERLRLKDFFQALVIAPGVGAEFPGQNNLVCDEIQVTNGRALNTSVQQNEFVDNSVHFLVWGGANNTWYETNTTSGGGGATLFGATMLLSRQNICFNPDTFLDTKFIGANTNARFTNSHFSDVGIIPDLNPISLESVNAKNTLIKGNFFENNGTPISMFGGEFTTVRENGILNPLFHGIEIINAPNSLVAKNNIEVGGADFGVIIESVPPGNFFREILGWGSNKNTRIHCNHIEGASEAGIAAPGGNLTLSGEPTDSHIAKNRFVDNALDLLFLVSGNTAVINPQDSVDDQTGDNKIIMTGSNNDCAP